jgi:hypothetical protein
MPLDPLVLELDPLVPVPELLVPVPELLGVEPMADALLSLPMRALVNTYCAPLALGLLEPLVPVLDVDELEPDVLPPAMLPPAASAVCRQPVTVTS